VSKLVFIDFLGYGDFRLNLCCEQPDKWFFEHKDMEVIKKKGHQEGWKFIPNPRFQHFPAHLKMVEDLNSYERRTL
jgi:hypothetical protein